MAVPKFECISVRAPAGKLIHATSLQNARKTACGKKCDGWAVAFGRQKTGWSVVRKIVTCDGCKREMGLPCRRHR